MSEGSVPEPRGVYGAMYVTSTTPRGVLATPGAGGRAAADTDPSPPDAVVHEVSRADRDFSEFYRLAWPDVARALSVALGDRDLAIEATDEAMARAYPRWDKLRGYDNPAAWAYRVGLNWARSYHRRLARRLPFGQPGVTVVSAATEAVDAAPVVDPAVRRALMELPVRQRSVVVCRLLLDWSIADTAQALGVRPGTVRSRLHRALQTLESSLHHLR